MSRRFDSPEFIAGYLFETEEHLGCINARLLTLEESLRRGAADPRAIRDLFRSLHTIKGLSAMVGIEPVVDIAHEMENYLRELDSGNAAIRAEDIDILLQGVRAIEVRAAALGKQQPVPQAPAELLTQLAKLLDSAPQTSRPGNLAVDEHLLAKLSPGEQEQLRQGLLADKAAYTVDFTPTVERTKNGISISTVREKVAQLADIVKIIPVSVKSDDSPKGTLVFTMLVLTRAEPAALAAASDGGAVRSAAKQDVDAPAADMGQDISAQGTVRVDVARLDVALDKLAALFVTRARLAREAQKRIAAGRDARELLNIAHDLARQVRDLRDSVMQARMISARDMLDRVPLMVRGLSHQSGKQLRLEVEAGDAELDKSVAERIFPALVHLVRNAVDHAIEQPAQRVEAGKDAEGKLRIACSVRSGRCLEMTITDDGRGIDVARLAARAGRPVPVDSGGILELLVLPGLSSLDVATHTSGRGMGMDIVKRVIVDELRGSLRVKTAAGVGTEFSVVVPISMTIMDAFAFGCGAHVFAVPTATVEEIIDVDASSIITPPSPHRSCHARMLERRGKPMLLLDLADALQLQAGDVRKAIVVDYNGDSVAIGVERMLGQQEIVVRPVIDPLVKKASIAGTTDLGDGAPTLVLDLLAIAANVAKEAAVTT